MRLLTPEAQHREEINNLANVFTRVDRVLSGRGDVRCQAVHSGSSAPAWSDGRTITFNVNRIKSITNVEDIVMITGLNYHELAHVLFTPRETHSVGQFVMNGGYQTAYNILEDQRIETFLTAQYPATAAYFTTTFMRYCLAREDQWEQNHVLAYGRRYLPRKVRDAFAKRFKWQEYRKDFERIIDTYRLLNPHKVTHAKKMTSLIRQFSDLLDMINPPDQPYGHGQGRPEMPDKGREQTSNQQDEAAEWAEWYDDDRDEQEAEEDQQASAGKGRDSKSDDDDDQEDSDDGDGGVGEDGDEGDGGSDSGDSSDDDDAEADGKGHGGSEDDGEDDGDAGDGESSGGADGDDDADDSDGAGSSSDGRGSRGDGSDDGVDDPADSDEESQGKGIGEGGSGDGQRHLDDQSELRGVIEDVMDGILNDAEIQREATAKQNSIINGTGQALPELTTKRASYMAPSPQMVNITRKFSKELERLRDDLDPGWERHKSSGRINVQRAIQGADLDTVWDQWSEGINDSTDFECVLYVDYSGSMMGSEMQRACEALWIIKRAIERVGGSVTVYAFDDVSSILYRPDQKAEADRVKIIDADGGTDPTGAINDSLRIFQQSRRKNKLAIFLTDGGWGGQYMWEKRPDSWPHMIQRMNAFGIVTALAVIGGWEKDYSEPSSRNYTQMAQNIDTAADLVGFAKAIVKQVMKESRR
jgi:hypothetical protein